MPKNYWLVKQEPETYSWATFAREQRTDWTGVRNFQARKHLRGMRKGDWVLFYHSGSEKAVVGLACVAANPGPDPTATEGDWASVELKAVRPLDRPVSLETIKADAQLQSVPMVRQSRLSVMPLTEAQFQRMAELGFSPASRPLAILIGTAIALFSSMLTAAEIPSFTDHPPQVLRAVSAGEGPAWNSASQSLYFTGDNRISRWERDGGSRVVHESAGGANGLLFDPQGRLVVCEAGNRRVTRIGPDATVTVLADSFEGMKFNSPNDLTIDSKGRIYFSDPRYGKRETMEMRDAQGRLVEGVYRIDGPGKVKRVLAVPDIDRPNGLYVAPGDRYLFVADNNNNTAGGARKLWRFNLRADGSVDPRTRRLLFDWKTSRGPDGIKMDRKNRLFVAAGLNQAHPPFETAEPYLGGVYVLNSNGKLLGFIPVPADEVTNCAFGGDDLRTLFITGGSQLWTVRVAAPGRITMR